MVPAMRVCPRCRSVYTTDLKRCSLDGVELVQQPTDPLVGHSLDRYQIMAAIGHGTMGRIYLARHQSLDRRYAIKTLYGEYGAERLIRERFRREAQAMSRLRHENIVSVIDFGTTREGLMFLVLEYVDGESLEQLIEREGPLDHERVVDITQQIARGLSVAHEHGYIHRDVKPGNVMVVKENGCEIIKLIDFGTVNLISIPQDERLTRIGHLVGTPVYMAPEQAQTSNVGPTADLYSLGVIMFEMLMGQPPFSGNAPVELLRKHLFEPPPRLPAMGGLGPLVEHLLTKNPRQRLQSADSIISRLDELKRSASAVHEVDDDIAPIFGPLSNVTVDATDAWSAWAPEVAVAAENAEHTQLTTTSALFAEAEHTQSHPQIPRPKYSTALEPAEFPADVEHADFLTEQERAEFFSSRTQEGPPTELEAPHTPLEEEPLDTHSLIYEPAIPGGPRRIDDDDDSATAIHPHPGEESSTQTDIPIPPESRTDLDMEIEALEGPLDVLPPPVPLQALMEEAEAEIEEFASSSRSLIAVESVELNYPRIGVEPPRAERKVEPSGKASLISVSEAPDPSTLLPPKVEPSPPIHVQAFSTHALSPDLLDNEAGSGSHPESHFHHEPEELPPEFISQNWSDAQALGIAPSPMVTADAIQTVEVHGGALSPSLIPELPPLSVKPLAKVVPTQIVIRDRDRERPTVPLLEELEEASIRERSLPERLLLPLMVVVLLLTVIVLTTAIVVRHNEDLTPILYNFYDSGEP